MASSEEKKPSSVKFSENNTVNSIVDADGTFKLPSASVLLSKSASADSPGILKAVGTSKLRQAVLSSDLGRKNSFSTIAKIASKKKKLEMELNEEDKQTKFKPTKIADMLQSTANQHKVDARKAIIQKFTKRKIETQEEKSLRSKCLEITHGMTVVRNMTKQVSVIREGTGILTASLAANNLYNDSSENNLMSMKLALHETRELDTTRSLHNKGVRRIGLFGLTTPQHPSSRDKMPEGVTAKSWVPGKPDWDLETVAAMFERDQRTLIEKEKERCDTLGVEYPRKLLRAIEEMESRERRRQLHEEKMKKRNKKWVSPQDTFNEKNASKKVEDLKRTRVLGGDAPPPSKGNSVLLAGIASVGTARWYRQDTEGRPSSAPSRSAWSPFRSASPAMMVKSPKLRRKASGGGRPPSPSKSQNTSGLSGGSQLSHSASGFMTPDLSQYKDEHVSLVDGEPHEGPQVLPVEPDDIRPRSRNIEKNVDYPEGQYKGRVNTYLCPEGQGTLTLHEGAVYKGTFVHGAIFGCGRIVYDSVVYEGQVVRGRPDGLGYMYNIKTKERYNGEFKAGKKDGLGVWDVPGRFIYEGEFKDDQRSGYGTLDYENGDRYEGMFKADYPDILGVHHRFEGDRFEGDIKKGLWQGQGVLWKSNGSRVDGMFSKDVPHGYAIAYNNNNRVVLRGKFDMGRFIETRSVPELSEGRGRADLACKRARQARRSSRLAVHMAVNSRCYRLSQDPLDADKVGEMSLSAKRAAAQKARRRKGLS